MCERECGFPKLIVDVLVLQYSMNTQMTAKMFNVQHATICILMATDTLINLFRLFVNLQPPFFIC